jgi:N6-adenosine-specific RNA methylase IME4
VRRLVEEVSPGPYLELFGRCITPGWTVLGNQIDRTLFDPELAVI